MAALREEVRGLLSDSASEDGSQSSYRDAHDGPNSASDRPPDLISESSGEEEDGPHQLLSSGAGAQAGLGMGMQQAAQQQTAQQQAAPRLGWGATAGLDDIDRSEDEGLGLWSDGEEDMVYDDEEDEEDEDDYFVSRGTGAGGASGGGRGMGSAGGLLGSLLPRGLQDLELNDGLLQQVPIQELLDAVLQGAGGPLAGMLGTGGPGGGPFGRSLASWRLGSNTGAMGPNGLRMFLSGGQGLLDASQIPAGLEGSARRHALNMAEQGFVTALDPARHAACAAEGIPGGRQRLASPRAPAGTAPAAAPLAAGRSGLQRADSASGGGGALRRGDSAASQGMSRLARQQGAGADAAQGVASQQAAGAPGHVRSRLGSMAHGSAGQHWARDAPEVRAFSSEEDDDPPPLLSSAEVSEGSPTEPSGSESSGQASSDGGSSDSGGSSAGHEGAGSAAQQQPQAPAAAAAAGGAGLPRRRQRRNAIFGQLPGLGRGDMGNAERGGLPELLSDDDGRAAGPPSGAHSQPQHQQQGAVPASTPLLADSDGSGDVGSAGSRPNRRRRAAAAAAALRRRLGITRRGSDSPPELESPSSSDSSRSSSRARSEAGAGPGATGLLRSSSGQEARHADEQAPQLASGSRQGSSPGNGGSSSSSHEGGSVPARTPASAADEGSSARRSGTPSPVLSDASRSSSNDTTPPLLATDDCSSSDDDEAPPMLSAENGSSSSSGDEPPPILASPDGSSVDDRHRNEDVPSLISDATYSSDSDFNFPGSQAVGDRGQAGPRLPGNGFVGLNIGLGRTLTVQPPDFATAQPQQQQQRGFSADQREVMQALAALLPQQHDAAGWAELAAYVHSHGGGSQRGSSGGVPLLSRLVAAAADRFPGEVEAAGLTERPLGPPPTAVTTTPALASAGTSSAGSPPHAPRPSTMADGGQDQGRQQQQQVAEVTLVVSSPRAAAELQQQLGSAVRVVAEAQLEAEAEQQLPAQQQQQWDEGPSTSAAGAARAAADPPAAAAGQTAAPPAAAAGQAAGPASAAAASAGAAALAALTASMRGGTTLQDSVANTEAALRLLAAPGVASQQPLPPLVAAAVAAASGPPPEQAEE